MKYTPKNIKPLVLGVLVCVIGVSIFVNKGFKPLFPKATYYIPFGENGEYGQPVGIVLIVIGLYFVSLYLKVLYEHFRK